MAAGFSQLTKSQIDSRIGQVIVQLRESFEDVAVVKAWLDAQTDQVLTGFGYDNDDIANIRSAFAALDKLADVAVGGDTVPNADDFFFFGRRLTGLA